MNPLSASHEENLREINDSMDDRELVGWYYQKGCQQHYRDTIAEILVTKHSPSIRAALLRQGVNADTAEELIQEVWAGAFVGCNGKLCTLDYWLTLDCTLPNFLIIQTWNHVDKINRKRRQNVPISHHHPPATRVDEDDPAEIAASHDCEAYVRRLIERACETDKQREIVRLRLDGLTFQQIADVLNQQSPEEPVSATSIGNKFNRLSKKIESQLLDVGTGVGPRRVRFWVRAWDYHPSSITSFDTGFRARIDAARLRREIRRLLLGSNGAPQTDDAEETASD